MSIVDDAYVGNLSEFETIDSDSKAYLLSLLLLNIKGTINITEDNNDLTNISIKYNNNKTVNYNENTYYTYDKYYEFLKNELDKYYVYDNKIYSEIIIMVPTKGLINVLEKHFKFIVSEPLPRIPNFKYDLSYFINNYDKLYVNSFMKAFFESTDSNIYYDELYENIHCTLSNVDEYYRNIDLKIISEYFNIPNSIVNLDDPNIVNLDDPNVFPRPNIVNLDDPNVFPRMMIEYNGTNAIDFLGIIYNTQYNRTKKYKDFKDILNHNKSSNPVVKFIKTSETAITPSKAHYSDVGFDISIINLSSEINSKTKLYNTGIKVEIPFGYYMEIVPRSSINKSGYMLSNSIGIIDTSYRGELFISLTKINDDSPDIVFPYKCAQLILKKQLYPEFIEVQSFSDYTKRHDNGFGSSGI